MTHEELVIERKWLIEMASKQITQLLLNTLNPQVNVILVVENVGIVDTQMDS